MKTSPMKQILFIDTRNATRSQIAEAWFNHFAADCGHAFSCGTMPANAIDPRTKQVLREIGIEPNKTPKPVNQQLLAHADIVVLMGKDVRPHAFKPNHIWDFQDLNGEPIEAVRELRDQIRVRVRELVAEIRLQEMESLRTVQDWQVLMLCLDRI